MGSKASAQSNLKLWYKQPAAKWTQALPIGNGTFGGMVFGGIDKEIIQLNDASLWTGGPLNLLPTQLLTLGMDGENTCTAHCKPRLAD